MTAAYVPRRVWWGTCARKRRYNTEHEALRALHDSQRHYGKAMHIYPCRFCYGWHVASGK